MKNLGKVANATNGVISRVDPSKLGGEFNKVVEEEIIGIDCEIKVYIYIKDRFNWIKCSDLENKIRKISTIKKLY